MQININDYNYTLPPERIAAFPPAERDSSKLLVYHNGTIENRLFKNIVDHLPAKSFLFFNDTKVIPARLVFRKPTGAEIEIFLLKPLTPGSFLDVMQSVNTCTWECAIGNLKKWNEGLELERSEGDVILRANLENRQSGIVKFTWDERHSFAEILSLSGKTPLPPYIKRPANEEDKERYQTIYSKFQGAVAAPTAGLHFTPAVFESLREHQIESDFVTLHVSAGTFQPVKASNAFEHPMHKEQIVIRRKNIENILHHEFIVAVGTTSMRTLESTYWYGCHLARNESARFVIEQNDPYRDGEQIGVQEALQAILKKMDRDKTDTLVGETSIYILPGYTFRICRGLITNFHQPGSTLILLVAAFIGHDWRKVYDTALGEGYRFLSYGDSSLLLPPMPEHATR